VLLGNSSLLKHEKKDGEGSDFGDERLPSSTRWEIQIMAERACLCLYSGSGRNAEYLWPQYEYG